MFRKIPLLVLALINIVNCEPLSNEPVRQALSLRSNEEQHFAAVQMDEELESPLRFVPSQAHRPPAQTLVQAQVLKDNLASAASQHLDALDHARSIMQTVINSGGLKGLPCATATADELLQILAWEFKRLPITHNGPINAGAAAIDDDTDVFTSCSNHYLQNVCQRYLMGVESAANFGSESDIMVWLLKYPAFKYPTHPTLREANDRLLYAANNWRKLQSGNFIYGKATYILNPNQQKTFVTPYDTGAYAYSKIACPFGTSDYFYHLLQPHLDAYKYDLSLIFQRWYGGAKAPKVNDYFYFEYEWSGNVWLPEALLYFIAFYDDMFGNSDGDKLRTWLSENKRPLVWGNGDDAGLIIDPFVNNVKFSVSSSVITPTIATNFQTMWTTVPKPSFATLNTNTDDVLHFQFPNYYRRGICSPLEVAGSPAQVMGTNAKDACVYWDWIDVPTLWECFNDGTCGQTMRGTYSTSAQCIDACANTKWTYQHNADIANNAGSLATTCVQDAQSGVYASVDACEYDPSRRKISPRENQCSCDGGTILASVGGSTTDVCSNFCQTTPGCECAYATYASNSGWTCYATTSTQMTIKPCNGCVYIPYAFKFFQEDGALKPTLNPASGFANYWCIGSSHPAPNIGAIYVTTTEECTSYCMNMASCSCAYTWYDMMSHRWICYATAGLGAEYTSYSYTGTYSWLKLYL